jgi:hypothetical protein
LATMTRGKTSKSAIKNLEVFIISAGMGESVVIHTPDNAWGVVDCYASMLSEPESNPTLQFLCQQNVTTLDFLCLTHPHSDHYRGMTHLIKMLSLECFWRFGATTREHLLNLLTYLEVNAREAGNDEELDSAFELQNVFDMILKLQKRGLTITRLSDIKCVYPLPIKISPEKPRPEFEIFCIAPPSNSIELYEKSLKNCFTVEGLLKAEAPKLEHNAISAALLLRFGKTRIILGGDVEAENWERILNIVDKSELAADAVKVSHHGSKNGYAPGLWAAFAAKKPPKAIITPFRKEELPDPDAIQHIKEHAEVVYCTCMPAIPYGKAVPVPQVYTSEVKNKLQEKLRSIRFLPRELGICSLCFDNHGHCTSVVLDGAAGRI